MMRDSEYMRGAERGGEALDALADRLNGRVGDDRLPEGGKVHQQGSGPGEGRYRRVLQLQTVAELLATPRPEWLVRGVLPRGALGVCFGAPGSGKTFLVTDLAAAIARGLPWFGRRTQQGMVVYICCEGTLRNRIEAYLQHNDITDIPNLRIHSSSINLLNPRIDTEPLIGALHDIGTVVLVVIDTLARALAGGNENAPEDMGALIGNAKRIQEATGAAVLFVHHSGKDTSRGSRGHSSLKGAADLEIEVTQDEAGNRMLTLLKVKDGEDGAVFGFRLAPVDLGPTSDQDGDEAERESSCVVEMTTASPVTGRKAPRRDIALDALREVIHEHGQKLPGTSTIPAGVRAVTLDQWRTQWTLRTGYDDGKSESIRVNFDKDRAALLKAGKVAISKPYVWITQ
jgi:hypothetical protein